MRLKMDTPNFADYILNEKDYSAKLEIIYLLSKRQKIFFDKSVVFKAELARLFLKYNSLGLDENIVLTACLLCNCKKVDNVQEIGKLKNYAKEGAEYLRQLGFEQRFCKICEEVNRYSGSSPRERESDVLELVDQFGGMLLNREERIGFEADEALVLLKHRNLKDIFNRYIDTFEQFVTLIDGLEIEGIVSMKVLKRMTKLYNETGENMDFIKKILYDFEPKVEKIMNSKIKDIKEEMFEKDNSCRPLFTEETTKKIIGDIETKTRTEAN